MQTDVQIRKNNQKMVKVIDDEESCIEISSELLFEDYRNGYVSVSVAENRLMPISRAPLFVRLDSFADIGCDKTVVALKVIDEHVEWKKYVTWNNVQARNFDQSLARYVGSVLLIIRVQMLKQPIKVRAMIAEHSPASIVIGLDCLHKLYPEFCNKMYEDFNEVDECQSVNQMFTVYNQFMMKGGSILDQIVKDSKLEHVQIPLDMVELASDAKELPSRLSKQVPKERINQIQQIVNKYASLFSKDKYDLGLLDVSDKRIADVGNCKTKISKKIRLSDVAFMALRRVLDKWKEHGYIVEGASSYRCNAFPVKKKNSVDPRCVINYGPVNDETKTDGFPQPTIEELLDKVRSCCFFSSIDLTSAYTMVKISVEDSLVLAFTDGKTQYLPKRMMQGIKNGVATMQRLLTEILKEEIEEGIVLNYLDDMLVPSRTWELHLEHLDRIMAKLLAAGVKCSPSKCMYGYTQIKFLGFVVNGDEMYPDPDLLSAVDKLVPPKNISQLQSVTGMFGVFRRFIPQFSVQIAPLNELKQKGKKFEMNEIRMECFEKMKQLVLGCKGIAIKDLSMEANSFIVMTDSSLYGMGACVAQKIQGQYRYVAFWSKAFTPSLKELALKQEIAKLEMIALSKALQQWSWLQFKPFHVLCDNQAVVHWFNKKELWDGCKTDWWAKVSHLSFDVKWIGTKKNLIADCMSRLPAPIVNQYISQIRKMRRAKKIAIAAMNHSEQRVVRARNKGQMSQFLQVDDDNIVDDDIGRLEVQSVYNQSVQQSSVDGVDDNQSLFDNLDSHEDVLDIFTMNLPRVQLEPKQDVKKQLIIDVHNQYFYPGKDAMIALMKNYFSWKGMTKDIENVLKDCLECEQFNNVNYNRNPQYKSRDDVYRGRTLSIDFGLYSQPWREEALYVLVMVDVATRYTFGFVMPSQDFKHVKLAFEKLFMTHIPKVIHCDNGSAFISKEFKDFMQAKRIDIEYAPAHFHASNGLAENKIGVIRMKVNKAREAGMEVNSSLLLTVISRINEIPNQSIGVTPYEAWFGQLPVFRLPKYATKETTVYIEIPKQLQEYNQKQKKRMLKYANKNACQIEYQPGEMVWVKNFNKTNSQPGNEKRMKVIRKIHGENYELVDETGRKFVYNVSQLAYSKPGIVRMHKQDDIVVSGVATTVKVNSAICSGDLTQPDDDDDGN